MTYSATCMLHHEMLLLVHINNVKDFLKITPKSDTKKIQEGHLTNL